MSLLTSIARNIMVVESIYFFFVAIIKNENFEYYFPVALGCLALGGIIQALIDISNNNHL